MSGLKARRSVSALAAFGIAAGAFAGPGVALIAAPTAVAQTAASDALFSATDTGSLTITKLDAPATVASTAPAGTKLDTLPAGTKGLDGAKFALYRIDAHTSEKLATNEGWAAAANVKASDFTWTAGSAPTGTTLVSEQTTANGGNATWANLPVGVYLLVETQTPQGYSGSANSIVHVPMTANNAGDNQGVAWQFDIHAYPKNEPLTVEKAVVDADKNNGDEVTYTITSDVPRLLSQSGQDVKLSKYIVEDDLQENIISTTADKVSVEGFTKGTDYNVTVDEATQKVTVTFTADGLTKLTANKKATPAYQVKTTITAAVKATDDANKGILKNDAKVIANNGGGAGDIEVDSNEVDTYFFNLVVNKHGEEETNKLQGAEFQLFKSVDDDKCTSADIVDGNRLEVGNADLWTTDVNGAITISGLHVNDYSNATEGLANPTKAYCLVETKAPKGYELNPAPHEVVFTKTEVEGGKYTFTANVENIPDTTPKLPMTGAAGIGLFGAIAAGALGGAALNNRRKKA